MTGFYEWLAEGSLWWWPRFADHLWQTTLFGLVVSVAAFTLRGGPARVRHNFWLLASAKFLVPAVLFVFLAQWAGIDSLPIFRSAPVAEQSASLVTGVTEPATAIALDYEVTVVANPAGDHREVYLALTAVWLAGCIGLVFVWAIRRRKFLHSLRLGRRMETGREWQALERARKTLRLQADIGLVISPLKIEPAAWRVWRPLVVMPESIASQLDDEELEAIMLHELVHIQRRDNLIGNLQLAVCALLWFHPLVWFISRRLFDEREQACDERVMEVGGAPEAYASSILKVVRFCFGWKMAGVTGAASGSNLRRRIENIMTMGNKKRGTGTATGLLASALVGIALLVLVGAGVYSKAQGRNASDAEVASVETAASSNTEVAFSLANVLGWTTQKSKRAIPPPPPPAQPVQAAQPPQAYHPAMPPPPEPIESAQPAHAPQPPPSPSGVPQPAQAPDPSSVPQPAQAPNPATVPQPPQSPPSPATPEPWQGSQPPHQVSSGMGAGKGAATGFGRGVATGVSVAPAHSIGGAVSAAGGHSVGTAAVVAPAASIGQGVSIAGGRGVGTTAVVAPAASMGQGVSIAGGRGSGTAASIAPGRAVGNGVSTAGGRGIATGVGGSAPSVAPARVAPAPASAVPAPRPLPAKQEKSRPQSKEKVEKGAVIEAPHPVYPVEAREQKIQGIVKVAIVIDESGKVVSARAKSGPESLYAASQDAAYKARFEPTLKEGKPIEIAATVSYNFVLTRN